MSGVYSNSFSHPVTHTRGLSLSLSGYIEGTFTLIWVKKRGTSSEEEEELFEKSDMTLMESGMEGGEKEHLIIKDKDSLQPQRDHVRNIT